MTVISGGRLLAERKITFLKGQAYAVADRLSSLHRSKLGLPVGKISSAAPAYEGRSHILVFDRSKRVKKIAVLGQGEWLNKVPEVALSFWIIKIMSTTVGETGADYLAVNAGLGQGVTGSVMAGVLAVALLIQLRTCRYTPWIYWLTVVLVSVVGTQITDFLTDSMGVSLYISSAVFAAALVAIFAIWYRVEGTLSINDINTRTRELFYWGAVLCTFALGTAAGDLATEALGLGFGWGVIAFGGLIGLTYAAWHVGTNAVLTFWIAYILTRPFGAALGDLLTQAKTYGGLGIGAMWTSALFLSVIFILVAIAQFGASRSVNAAK